MEPKDNEQDAVWVPLRRRHWEEEFDLDQVASDEQQVGEEDDLSALAYLELLRQELAYRWADLCMRWHFATW